MVIEHALLKELEVKWLQAKDVECVAFQSNSTNKSMIVFHTEYT